MADVLRGDDEQHKRSLERHTGADSRLKFTDDPDPHASGGEYEFPITNVSWTRDYSTSDIQHNGSLKATLGTTEIRFSGSFEYEGQNPKLIEHIMHGEDSVVESQRPVRGTITVTEYNHDEGKAGKGKVESTITFKRVMVTNHNRDVSSGDASTSSFDWEAEDMLYTPGSNSE